MRAWTRFLAGCCAFASLDARAHDAGGFIVVALMFLIGLGGVLASFIVHVNSTASANPARWLTAAVVAAANVVACVFVGWLVLVTAKVLGVRDLMPTFYAAVALLPWILPAVLYARWRLRSP